jgi:hypothetical protein
MRWRGDGAEVRISLLWRRCCCWCSVGRERRADESGVRWAARRPGSVAIGPRPIGLSFEESTLPRLVGAARRKPGRVAEVAGPGVAGRFRATGGAAPRRELDAAHRAARPVRPGRGGERGAGRVAQARPEAAGDRGPATSRMIIRRSHCGRPPEAICNTSRSSAPTFKRSGQPHPARGSPGPILRSATASAGCAHSLTTRGDPDATFLCAHRMPDAGRRRWTICWALRARRGRRRRSPRSRRSAAALTPRRGWARRTTSAAAARRV